MVSLMARKYNLERVRSDPQEAEVLTWEVRGMSSDPDPGPVIMTSAQCKLWPCVLKANAGGAVQAVSPLLASTNGVHLFPYVSSRPQEMPMMKPKQDIKLRLVPAPNPVVA
jgi:hypothetical protein